jgi:hypothetical protein
MISITHLEIAISTIADLREPISARLRDMTPRPIGEIAADVDAMMALCRASTLLSECWSAELRRQLAEEKAVSS